MSMEETMEAFLERKNRLDDVEREGREATSEESYEKEFAKLREMSASYKAGNVYPTAEGEKSCNTAKNRYKDIIPFDQTRVKLKNIKDDSASDYINASFIKSTVGGQTYIAAQGPTPKTVNDFWQMIWENNVKVVFMACREFEGDPLKLKCQRYWPNSEKEEMFFGTTKVTLSKEETTKYKEHLIRHMVAKSGGESRTLVQLHYQEWPDRGVPRCISGILDFIEYFRNILDVNKDETSPAIVHCSAGCGRTGTILVIDYVLSLLKYGKLANDFSIFDIIAEMRRQRMAIVQSLEQYVFVHEAVAELFKRQLSLINSHIYGNVDLSGSTHSKPQVIDLEIVRSPDKKKPTVPGCKPMLPKSSGSLGRVPQIKRDSEGSPDQPTSSDVFSFDQPLPSELQYAQPFASPIAKQKPPLVAISPKPNAEIPPAPIYGAVNRVALDCTSMNKNSRGDYSYANPDQTGKWSLQAIALGQKVESTYATIDEAGYQAIEIYPGGDSHSKINGGSSKAPEIPVKKYHPDEFSGQLASKEDRNPIMNNIRSILNIGKQEFINPSQGCEIAQIIFRDVNISFPNRVGKPRGKRLVKMAQVSAVH